MARAIIFIPLDDPNDQRHAYEGLNYLRRRGYGFYAVLRRLDIALSLLAEGRVDVIRFPPSAAADRAAEVMDEGPTRRFTDCATGSFPVVGQFGMGRPDDIRRVLEDSGPIPTGLDPAAIWAARRIARHFQDHGCG